MVGVRFRRRNQGKIVDLMAPVIIDATVEGDVLASAGEEGADWMVGRESVKALKGRAVSTQTPGTRRTACRQDHRLPPHPGWNWRRRQGRPDVPVVQQQGHCQRDRWVPEGWPDQSPSGYRRPSVLRDDAATAGGAGVAPLPGLGVPAGRWVQQVLPDGKLDLNLDPIGMNRGYVKGSHAERRAIATRIRNFELGFLYHLRYVLGHSRLGLSDDYPDSWPGIHRLAVPHYPPELYVREGRRMVGEVRCLLRVGRPEGPARPSSGTLGSARHRCHWRIPHGLALRHRSPPR